MNASSSFSTSHTGDDFVELDPPTNSIQITDSMSTVPTVSRNNSSESSSTACISEPCSTALPLKELNSNIQCIPPSDTPESSESQSNNVPNCSSGSTSINNPSTAVSFICKFHLIMDFSMNSFR